MPMILGQNTYEYVRIKPFLSDIFQEKNAQIYPKEHALPLWTIGD